MPSEQHNGLACMSLRWLKPKVTGRGLRGGFEVPLDRGYVADAAALCCFQYRYAKSYIGEAHFDRLDDYESIIPEVLCIFEAKASRADFLATFGSNPKQVNRRTPIGNLHWCVTGRGVAKAEELPDFWGLLTVRGFGLHLVRKPQFRTLEEHKLNAAAYQILWYAKPDHKPFTQPLFSLHSSDFE